MDVPDEANEITVHDSCEEVYCNHKSSLLESRSDDNHMSMFLL